MPEQSPAGVCVNRDPSESFAINLVNTVVASQALINERVLRREQLKKTPICLQLALEKQYRLPFHVDSQVLIEIKKDVGVRRHPSDAAKL